jgi:predicted LPLAT superfamily acyltransferase
LSANRWAAVAELGTARALRFAGALQRHVGRRGTLLIAWPSVLYFFLRSRQARRGSRRYLERLYASPEARVAIGRRPGARAVLHHLYEFSVQLYDRLVIWSGQLDTMQVEHDGSGLLFDLARRGEGALLLGAHLGSIDMLRLLSEKYQLVVNVVAFFGNAERINAFFGSLDSETRVRVIDIDPGSVRAAFEIRACLKRGEFVAILADRTAPGKTSRVTRTMFLGDAADFPLAPFQLAGVLDCPVFFALCVRRGDTRYETVLRPIATAERVPRGEREKRASELLERYVALLESYCRELPYQWFNFYDFWGDER